MPSIPAADRRAGPEQAADPGRPGPRARPGPGPGGFTVSDFTAKVRHLIRHDGYTTRQASYDLRKLRGKGLTDKPGRTRRYHVPPQAARTIAALLALRNHVIAPILAGVRSPRTGRKPKIWTAVDRDYENLRIGMQTLFRHAASRHSQQPHRQHFVDRSSLKRLRSVRDFARKEWPCGQCG